MSGSARIRAVTGAAATILALAAAALFVGPAAAVMNPTDAEITDLGVKLSSPSAPQSGTVSSSGTTVTGSGDIFVGVIAGDIINANGQDRTVVSVDTASSPDVLTVDAAFTPDLPSGTPWSLSHLQPTQAGAHPNVNLVFRFCDQPGAPPAPQSGTVSSSGTTVTGSGDIFGGVNSGSIIRASGQDREVVSVDTAPSPDVLTVSTAFTPDLTSGTAWSLQHPEFTRTHGCTFTTDWQTGTIQSGQMAAFLKDFTLHLPPGFLGNPLSGTGNPPTLNPLCPTMTWVASSCPTNTIVGGSFTQALSVTDADLPSSDVFVITPVFSVEPLGAEPARLGTALVGATPPGPLPITIALRSDGDYGIDSTLIDIPIRLGNTRGKIVEIRTSLCGIGTVVSPAVSTSGKCPAANAPGGKPFFVNPTSCDPATVSLDASSWSTPTVVNRSTSFTPTGCQNVPFEPTVTAKPDSDQAGAPTGYTVAIQYPRGPNCPALPAAPDCTYENDAIWQSALKDADVTLPEGVSLAAGGAVGLDACTDQQFGFGNKNPVTCPDSSQIGTVKVTTPVLPAPLEGKAFFGPTGGRAGRPTPDHPWKLFLLIEGQGLRIKLVGDVSVSPSGQVRTTFSGQPQVPFSRFELHTRGGNNAVLANPRTCTEHAGEAVLTGWADNPTGVRKVKSSTLSVTPTGCNPQFKPVVEDASAVPTQAGASSVSHLRITRSDDSQLIKQLTLSLPAGAAGSLAGVPLCSKGQAAAGDCSEASKVGTIRTTVGYGDAVLTQSGSLYLGEAVAPGDVASFVIVVPARVGPIDLGKVVVVNRVRLRPSDTGVDVISADIPTVLEGVPLPVKVIDITVDRDNFFLNPTGCDRRLFVATFRSDEGLNARGEFPAQATGCDRLPFKPKLRLIAGAPGLTKEGAHPPLKAIVTQSPGQANIAKARVTLPDIIRPNVPQFQKPGALCNDAQLAARACPALSQIGTAEVDTPLLPFQLSGPVYIVLRSGSPLPSLAVFLRGGGFEVVLNATNGFSGIRILNTFEPVPDVPQQHFELTVKGGSNGILNAFKDLCKTDPLPTFDATFFGHNGKTATSKPRLEADGCSTASSLGVSASIATRSVRMSRSGVVKIKVRCRGQKACKGRLSLQSAKAVKSSKKRKVRMGGKSFSIRARKTKAIKVKLPGKARRAVIRNRRVVSRATLALRGGKRVRGTVTIKAPRKK